MLGLFELLFHMDEPGFFPIDAVGKSGPSARGSVPDPRVPVAQWYMMLHHFDFHAQRPKVRPGEGLGILHRLSSGSVTLSVGFDREQAQIGGLRAATSDRAARVQQAISSTENQHTCR